MDKLKAYIFTCSLFVANGVINFIYQTSLNDNPKALFLLLYNLIPALIFLFIYKLKKENIELVYGVFSLLYCIFLLFVEKVHVVEYSMVLVYGSFLILKHTKIKIVPTIFMITFVFSVIVCNMILIGGNIARLSGSIMFITTMGLIHYVIYYNEYKTEPKHDFTDKEVLIIKELFEEDPSNKNIANKLNISEASVKADLGRIYAKMGINYGGGKKTELAVKLARCGWL